jgi:deoxyadenosine kinase
MKKPNVIVHLDVTPEGSDVFSLIKIETPLTTAWVESLNRIKERARGCEVGITIEYLTALRDAYEDFIDDISRVIPVIRVDWSKFRTAEEMVVFSDEAQQASNFVRVFFFCRLASLRANIWR